LEPSGIESPFYPEESHQSDKKMTKRILHGEESGKHNHRPGLNSDFAPTTLNFEP
jgi:hypothetical protein